MGDNYLHNNFPNYDCDVCGNVFKNGELIKPFKSNKYLQVCIYDNDNKKHTVGVHTVIAMKYFDDYYPGCVVHHKDDNKHNNHAYNLEVKTRSKHSSDHMKGNYRLAEYTKEHGPWNKGKKMSDEFCKKCSESAIKRHKRENSKAV